MYRIEFNTSLQESAMINPLNILARHTVSSITTIEAQGGYALQNLTITRTHLGAVTRTTQLWFVARRVDSVGAEEIAAYPELLDEGVLDPETGRLVDNVKYLLNPIFRSFTPPMTDEAHARHLYSQYADELENIYGYTPGW
jgi:hypothetical protein